MKNANKIITITGLIIGITQSISAERVHALITEVVESYTKGDVTCSFFKKQPALICHKFINIRNEPTKIEVLPNANDLFKQLKFEFHSQDIKK